MSAGELTSHALHGMQPVLGVPDVAAAGAWYRDALGFRQFVVEDCNGYRISFSAEPKR